MSKNGKVNSGHNNEKIEADTQVYNPATGNYIRRDAKTGKFTEVKSGIAFKGLVKEKKK